MNNHKRFEVDGMNIWYEYWTMWGDALLYKVWFLGDDDDDIHAFGDAEERDQFVYDYISDRIDQTLLDELLEDDGYDDHTNVW